MLYRDTDRIWTFVHQVANGVWGWEIVAGCTANHCVTLAAGTTKSEEDAKVASDAVLRQIVNNVLEVLR